MAIIDRLKCEFGSDELVRKWPSDELSVGTQLIVNESQQALFFKGGKALDLFGPGTHTLSSANLPLLRGLINLPFGGKTPFTAEVYFANMSAKFAQTWGTKTPIMLRDPRYGFLIPVRAYGEYAVQIDNAREFIIHVVDSSHGASAGTIAQEMLRSPIVSCIQQALGNFMKQRNVSVLDLPIHAQDIVEHVLELLSFRYKTFGVEILNFTIENINFDPNDESVVRLRASLDESTRLDVVGESYRRNQDFYRADRQFNVLQGAAENDGVAGNMMGATLGIGMGFGVANPAGDLARQSMAPTSVDSLRCANCQALCKLGSGFCGECGNKLKPPTKTCPHCEVENATTSKFCHECGKSLNGVSCRKCQLSLAVGVKFCPECGEDQR